MNVFDRVLGYFRDLLQREPARVVAYGSSLVVWIVVKVAQLNGAVVPDDTLLAIGQVATFILTEVIRSLVYSPAAVAAIVNTPPTAAGPILAAEAAGVDTTQPDSEL